MQIKMLILKSRHHETIFFLKTTHKITSKIINIPNLVIDYYIDIRKIMFLNVISLNEF